MQHGRESGDRQDLVDGHLDGHLGQGNRNPRLDVLGGNHIQALLTRQQSQHLAQRRIAGHDRDQSALRVYLDVVGRGRTRQRDLYHRFAPDRRRDGCFRSATFDERRLGNDLQPRGGRRRGFFRQHAQHAQFTCEPVGNRTRSSGRRFVARPRATLRFHSDSAGRERRTRGRSLVRLRETGVVGRRRISNSLRVADAWQQVRCRQRSRGIRGAWSSLPGPQRTEGGLSSCLRFVRRSRDRCRGLGGMNLDTGMP